MVKVIFEHLYVIVMAIVVVTAGNILADQYGSAISSGISDMVNSADKEITDVQNSVVDWNKKILD